MEKLLIVLWDRGRRTRSERSRVLRDEVAPALLAQGVVWLGLLVADEHARVRSPNPFPLFERRAAALVNGWVASLADYPKLAAAIDAAGFTFHAYHVEESVYRDYGDNPHAPPRSWPDGVRSPGITAVTFLVRPARLDPETWLARWYGVMSPVSEAIQPRTRYVRNRVLRALSAAAPPFAGIVEEAWPSARHVTNPFLFYGARTLRELIVNVFKILRAVTSFLTLHQIRTVMMSEYFVRTALPTPASEFSAGATKV